MALRQTTLRRPRRGSHGRRNGERCYFFLFPEKERKEILALAVVVIRRRPRHGSNQQFQQMSLRRLANYQLPERVRKSQSRCAKTQTSAAPWKSGPSGPRKPFGIRRGFSPAVVFPLTSADSVFSQPAGNSPAGIPAMAVLRIPSVCDTALSCRYPATGPPAACLH